MSYITAIGISVPPHKINQSAICNFMEKKMGGDPSIGRKIRAVFRASGIEYRHSVLPDYGRTSGFTFYPESASDDFPSTGKRMNLFRENALPLSLASVKNMLESKTDFRLLEVTHLIVVSCTGMYAPGLDIDLIKALKLNNSVQRTCIQFMGCYAAFNALKVANAFCKCEASAKVLIVCTELCSIHFQQAPSEDNILANALFADGSAALLVEAVTTSEKKLSFQNFHNELAVQGEADMAWNIADAGFEMRLSSYIPDLLRSEIQGLINTLLLRIGKNKNDLKYFALHPGGKKILETIENQLGLKKEDNAPAYKVLKNYGNMSSATVLFVLKEIFSGLSREDNNESILSMGFGPGLTLESMLLNIKIG
jgi:prepilin-type processing-associated H-X9-DG protein